MLNQVEDSLSLVILLIDCIPAFLGIVNVSSQGICIHVRAVDFDQMLENVLAVILHYIFVLIEQFLYVSAKHVDVEALLVV